MDTIMFGPTDYEKASCGGYGGRGTVGKGLNTESKIYGCIASDRIQNEEKIDFYLSTNKIEGYPKIISLSYISIGEQKIYILTDEYA